MCVHYENGARDGLTTSTKSPGAVVSTKDKPVSDSASSTARKVLFIIALLGVCCLWHAICTYTNEEEEDSALTEAVNAALAEAMVAAAELRHPGERLEWKRRTGWDQREEKGLHCEAIRAKRSAAAPPHDVQSDAPADVLSWVLLLLAVTMGVASAHWVGGMPVVWQKTMSWKSKIIIQSMQTLASVVGMLWSEVALVVLQLAWWMIWSTVTLPQWALAHVYRFIAVPVWAYILPEQLAPAQSTMLSQWYDDAAILCDHKAVVPEGSSRLRLITLAVLRTPGALLLCWLLFVALWLSLTWAIPLKLLALFVGAASKATQCIPASSPSWCCEAEVPAPPWWVGAQVRLRSLRLRPDLNGQHGTVLHWSPTKARYEVEVSTSRERVWVKAQSLAFEHSASKASTTTRTGHGARPKARAAAEQAPPAPAPAPASATKPAPQPTPAPGPAPAKVSAAAELVKAGSRVKYIEGDRRFAVTGVVVATHVDAADGAPYYTVRLQDGTERQTVRSRLLISEPE